MPKLKVKSLEWYMRRDPEDFAEEGYYTPLPADFPLLGRDGYYCRGENVWFEFGGIGYSAYPSQSRQRARETFCYDLTVNDEAILPQREEIAMRAVLRTSRDSTVKKALGARLRLHTAAIELRATGRNARLTRIRILGR